MSDEEERSRVQQFDELATDFIKMIAEEDGRGAVAEFGIKLRKLCKTKEEAIPFISVVKGAMGDKWERTYKARIIFRYGFPGEGRSDGKYWMFREDGVSIVDTVKTQAFKKKGKNDLIDDEAVEEGEVGEAVGRKAKKPKTIDSGVLISQNAHLTFVNAFLRTQVFDIDRRLKVLESIHDIVAESGGEDENQVALLFDGRTSALETATLAAEAASSSSASSSAASL